MDRTCKCEKWSHKIFRRKVEDLNFFNCRVRKTFLNIMKPQKPLKHSFLILLGKLNKVERKKYVCKYVLSDFQLVQQIRTNLHVHKPFLYFDKEDQHPRENAQQTWMVTEKEIKMDFKLWKEAHSL